MKAQITGAEFIALYFQKQKVSHVFEVIGGMIALEIAGRRPAGLRGVIALEGWVHHTVQRNAFPPRRARTTADAAKVGP